MSGKNYNFIPYGVDDNGILNYDELERLTKEHHPKLIVAGRVRLSESDRL